MAAGEYELALPTALDAVAQASWLEHVMSWLEHVVSPPQWHTWAQLRTRCLRLVLNALLATPWKPLQPAGRAFMASMTWACKQWVTSSQLHLWPALTAVLAGP